MLRQLPRGGRSRPGVCWCNRRLGRSHDEGKMSVSSALPVIGAALLVEDLERHHNWIIEGNRDLELQDFDVVGVLEDNAWRPIVEGAKRWLDGYEGRLGIHGPFRDVPLACTDPSVRRIVDYRMNQALDICEALGATNIVVNSPFTIRDYDYFDHFPDARVWLWRRGLQT